MHCSIAIGGTKRRMLKDIDSYDIVVFKHVLIAKQKMGSDTRYANFRGRRLTL